MKEIKRTDWRTCATSTAEGLYLFFGNCLISFTEKVFDGGRTSDKESLLLPTSPISAGVSGRAAGGETAEMEAS